jgi:hypothetical protein
MWVYSVEGQVMAKGPAMVTPLALDLAMLVDTFNGHWDRDNVGPVGIYSASTIESPFASAVSYLQAAAASVDFIQMSDSRYMLTNVDQTVATQEAMLVIIGASTVRVMHSLAAAPGQLPLFVGLGIEVDGQLVYHTGYEMIRVQVNVAYGVELAFAASAAVAVGAGNHTVRMFYDFVRGEATANVANCALEECRQLETFLMIEEVRR